jgi:cytosine/creatinine deaminase
MATPSHAGIARVKELLAAGVNVACGQDDIQNMFYPFGKMDPLEVALISAHAAHGCTRRDPGGL